MQEVGELIRQRFEALDPVLDEQGRRRFAAAEARALGRGGVTLVSNVTGIARSTINRGLAEIDANRVAGKGRVRRPGGGRKAKTVENPALLDALKGLLEAATRGDPMSPLLWTSRSLKKLASALQGLGHEVCPNVVAKMLRDLGYSLQSNRKTQQTSRSGCAVSLSGRANERAYGAGRARHFGRYQEKRTGRRFQERRARMAAEG